jgi:hypothetical protein
MITSAVDHKDNVDKNYFSNIIIKNKIKIFQIAVFFSLATKYRAGIFTDMQNGSLILFDVFMNKTLHNLEGNSNVAVTVFMEV